MLEKLSDPRFRTLHRHDPDVVLLARRIFESTPEPIIGEIGVGIGATTLKLCETLSGRGELHIFDLDSIAPELADDLRQRGHANVVCHANSARVWDSYSWSLMKIIEAGRTETFDLFYIDGCHTLFHEGLAFMLCDRLLKVGGYLVFDDYGWCFNASATVSRKHAAKLTEEQLSVPQIKMLVDNLVRPHIGYEVEKENKTFRKVRSIWRHPPTVDS